MIKRYKGMFVKGQSSLRKGIILTEETKKKISDTLKKEKIAPINRKKNKSKKHREKISKSLIGRLPNSGSFKRGIRVSPKTEFTTEKMSGKNNINWKGGITPINLKIRASKEYKQWRKSVFKKDNYTCVKCNQVGGTLNADHIKSFALFPKLRFNVSNGRTLCVSCHRKTDTFGGKTK